VRIAVSIPPPGRFRSARFALPWALLLQRMMGGFLQAWRRCISLGRMMLPSWKADGIYLH
jgi:hypothetical protein